MENFFKKGKNFEKYIRKILKFAKKPANSCIKIQKCRNMRQICRIRVDLLAYAKYALNTFEQSIPELKVSFFRFSERTFEEKYTFAFFYTLLINTH